MFQNVLDYKISILCGILVLIYIFQDIFIKRPYKMFVAWAIHLTLSSCEESLKEKRARIFSFVHQHQQTLKRDIDVLEIGSGSANNFEFLPQNTKLTCLEPNEYFDSYASESFKTHDRGIKTEIKHGYAEDMPFADGSFDVVVSTLVLCSVADMAKVLSESIRVLRPGGKFVFLEHVVYKEKWSLRHVSQLVMFPLQYCVFDRCRPSRDTGKHINEAGFSDVEFELYMEKSFPLWIKPVIFGAASK